LFSAYLFHAYDCSLHAIYNAQTSKYDTDQVHG